MNNILIIGSNGFIGQNICRKLTLDGYHVLAADIATSSTHHFCHSYTDFNVLTDSFAPLINEADCIIYLVSTLLPLHSNHHTIRDINENLIPIIRLMESMRHSEKCKKIIFASSGGTIYGGHEKKITENSNLEPKCSYGIMKLAVEKYLILYSDMYNIQTISLRISNPYGLGQDCNRPQGVVASFLDKMRQNLPIEIWGDGTIIRDYIYVDDVATAFSAAIRYNEKTSEVFNIGTGKGTSLNELLDILFALTGSVSRIAYSSSRNIDPSSNILDIKKANNLLAWTPSIPLHEGLKKLISLQKMDIVSRVATPHY